MCLQEKTILLIYMLSYILALINHFSLSDPSKKFLPLVC